MTPDGHWYVEKNYGCSGGWTVTDTTGRHVCTSCFSNNERHATVVRTLCAAKAFISHRTAVVWVEVDARGIRTVGCDGCLVKGDQCNSCESAEIFKPH